MDIPPQRIKHMKCGTDITREMNKLYGEARKGNISTQDLTRYGSFLNILLGVIRETELEADIRSLREAMKAQGIPIKNARPQLVKTAA